LIKTLASLPVNFLFINIYTLFLLTL
jgi:hypothetical protein